MPPISTTAHANTPATETSLATSPSGTLLVSLPRHTTRPLAASLPQNDPLPTSSSSRGGVVKVPRKPVHTGAPLRLSTQLYCPPTDTARLSVSPSSATKSPAPGPQQPRTPSLLTAHTKSGPTEKRSASSASGPTGAAGSAPAPPPEPP